MGASSSCLNTLDTVVYISYDLSDKINKKKYTLLFDELEKKNLTIISSKNFDNKEFNYNSNYNNELVHNVSFIIVCLTSNYLKCVQQIKELNKILERENGILYLRMDNNDLLTQTELNGLIKKNECFLLEEKNMEKILDIVLSRK